MLKRNKNGHIKVFLVVVVHCFKFWASQGMVYAKFDKNDKVSFSCIFNSFYFPLRSRSIVRVLKFKMLLMLDLSRMIRLYFLITCPIVFLSHWKQGWHGRMLKHKRHGHFSSFPQDFGQVQKTQQNFQEIVRVAFRGACLVAFFNPHN